VSEIVVTFDLVLQGAGVSGVFNESRTTAFADANYTPVCTMNGPANGTASWSLNGWTASSVQIILTSTGLASTYGGLDCIASAK